MDSSTRNIRDDILAAGLAEFSHQGFDGARLERIAKASGCAKRMIYYYFESKEGLYLAVLERAYADIRASEGGMELHLLPPRDALARLAEASFDYHERNVDFTRLVLMENLQGGHLVGMMGSTTALRDAAFTPLREILMRGEVEGVFRSGIDAIDLHYMISALSAFRIDHARTWKSILDVDLMSDGQRDRQRKLIVAVILRFVSA